MNNFAEKLLDSFTVVIATIIYMVIMIAYLIVRFAAYILSALVISVEEGVTTFGKNIQTIYDNVTGYETEDE